MCANWRQPVVEPGARDLTVGIKVLCVGPTAQM